MMASPAGRGTDRVVAIGAAALLGVYAAIADIGAVVTLLPPPPDAIRDGAPGLIVFSAIPSTYGVLAILQDAFRVLRRWRPSILQCATVTWVGGWLWLVVGSDIAIWVSEGAAAVRDMFGFDVALLALFIGLPWAIVRLRARRSADNGRAFLDR